jgi:Fic family protein
MSRFDKIDRFKTKLDSLHPLPREVVQNLHEDLVLRWTYNSNAIEGNTLTLKETKVALEGITVGGKTLREHFEAINHREAILYVEDIIKRNEKFSAALIRRIHAFILKNIDDENAGVYRRVNVTVAGVDSIPPDALQVLLIWMHLNSGTTVCRAVCTPLKLPRLHSVL